VRIAQANGRITSRVDAPTLTHLFALMLNAVVLECARCDSLQDLPSQSDAVVRIFVQGAVESTDLPPGEGRT
jgi:hypothetical protein